MSRKYWEEQFDEEFVSNDNPERMIINGKVYISEQGAKYFISTEIIEKLIASIEDDSSLTGEEIKQRLRREWQ